MNITRTCLDPGKKLVDATAEALIAKTRCDARTAFAKSLAHVMVVVPTAQAARNLRKELAKKAGAVLPPRVMQPMDVVFGETRPSPSELAKAAFVDFAMRVDAKTRWPHLFGQMPQPDAKLLIAFYDQLSDIWRALAGGSLTMQDVPEMAAQKGRVQDVFIAAQGDEDVRWQELADLEKEFFKVLGEKGILHDSAAIRRARNEPPPPPEEVEEIMLPALADPMQGLYSILEKWMEANPRLCVNVALHADESEKDLFDKWGRPLPDMWTLGKAPIPENLTEHEIHVASSAKALARNVAEEYAKSARSMAVGLADGDLSPELEAAFLNCGAVLHNPQMHRLAASSLGAAAINLLRVWEMREAGAEVPWRVFHALLHADDVLAAIAGKCNASGATAEAILAAVEKYHAETFAGTLAPDSRGFAKSRHSLARAAAVVFVDMVEEARAAAPGNFAGFLRSFLLAVYEGRHRARNAYSEEFAVAAEALVGAMEILEHPVARALGKKPFADFAADVLGNALYSLEPAAADVVKTEGWLELAWSAADEISIAGMHEGKVPDSLTGHPFLPDALRSALGIGDNARRLARDAFLLREMLRCREKGAVRCHVSKTSPEGDAIKPSRLLFLCKDGDLAQRAEKLFGNDVEIAQMPARAQCAAARLVLGSGYSFPNKTAEQAGSVSPSSIDSYLRCPFTWFLAYGCGLRKDDPREAMEKTDFGTLAHGVLEDFANAEIKHIASTGTAHRDEREIVEMLEESCARATAHLEPATQRVALQMEALKKRILAFAPIQAQWAREGWQPYSAEMKLHDRPKKTDEKVFLFGRDLPYLTGSIDRVDWHPVHGFRVIDYKTWDSAAKVSLEGHLFAGGDENAALAKMHKYPLFKTSAHPLAKEKRFLSVQVPLYALALARKNAQVFCRDGVSAVNDACYLVLGKSAGDVCVWGSRHRMDGFAAESNIVLMDFAQQAYDTAKSAVEAMAQGIFWPPAPGDLWQRDFASLFVFSPKVDLRGEWLDAQETRLAAFAGEGGDL